MDKCTDTKVIRSSQCCMQELFCTYHRRCILAYAAIAIKRGKMKREKRANTTRCGMHQIGGLLALEILSMPRIQQQQQQSATQHPAAVSVYLQSKEGSQAFRHAATTTALAPWSCMHGSKRLGPMPLMADCTCSSPPLPHRSTLALHRLCMHLARATCPAEGSPAAAAMASLPRHPSPPRAPAGAGRQCAPRRWRLHAGPHQTLTQRPSPAWAAAPRGGRPRAPRR